VTAKRPELFEATNETIADAVQYADPMVLRGLLYQLTGDDDLIQVSVESVQQGGRTRRALTDAHARLVRSKAATFLKWCRDAGTDDIPAGPPERLRRSLSFTVGTEIPAAELEMWTEQLALDPFAHGLVWPAAPRPERLEEISVVVIGAGMGGLCAAVQLRHAGIPFTVVEKNSEVGGTWYENRYPGARVDTESRTYTHVFGAEYPYPSPYCEQSENEKYLNWVTDHFDVRKHIVFETEVRSMMWEEEAAVWNITAEGPEGRQSWRANAVITAVGFLSRPHVPQIDGIDTFRGRCFHTARWPAGTELAGQRVALAGSGCTGYQLAVELVKEVDHLYLFQRTPSWVFEVPGYLSPYPPQVNWLDRNFPYLVNFVRFANAFMRHPATSALVSAVDPTFEDPHAVSAVNKWMRDERIHFMRSKLAERPDLMEKMLPYAPPFSSRPVIADRDNCIYDVLLRENVTLISEGVSTVTENAVLLSDGTECAVDALILATGFKANEFLWPMEVRGRGALGVEDLWAKDGARAYLGNMLPGFPNFFMLYGPNTNNNVGVGAVALEELVTRFAVQCISALITQDKRTVEVTPEAYVRYNDALDEAQATKVYLDPRAHTYWQTEFGRSAINGAFDARLLWEWLRDPRDPERATSRADEDEIMRMRDLISPYLGRDLLLN
jgi:4-hydroxyacetophenone monooxygenase